jgi:DNA-binding response OmpR family regulator
LLDGETLSRIRRDCPAQPSLAWLSQVSSERTADLLEQGVGEVISSGMSDRELVARVAAALRVVAPGSSQVVYGSLEIDSDAAEARWEGADLRLTRRERQVLQVLAGSAGRTVRRELLYRQVWGYAMARGDRSVDVNIKRLRAKLADVTSGLLEITTQPGVGYRLELSESQAPVKKQRAAVTAL